MLLHCWPGITLLHLPTKWKVEAPITDLPVGIIWMTGLLYWITYIPAHWMVIFHLTVKNTFKSISPNYIKAILSEVVNISITFALTDILTYPSLHHHSSIADDMEVWKSVIIHIMNFIFTITPSNRLAWTSWRTKSFHHQSWSNIWDGRSLNHFPQFVNLLFFIPKKCWAVTYPIHI